MKNGMQQWYIVLAEGYIFRGKQIISSANHSFEYIYKHDNLGFRTKRKAVNKLKYCPIGSYLGRVTYHYGEWYGGEEWDKVGRVWE